MNYEQIIQSTINYIDDHITSEINSVMLAESACYSLFHFSRVFKEMIGISVMSYITWRKLQYALYDLSQGKKVTDVAMEYGFETHSGFTKAFVHCYGFPPSLCYMRISANPPIPMNTTMLKNKFSGGKNMNPHIIELTPFTVVGYPSHHTKANMKNTADAPTFWNTINLDYSTLLTKLYEVFPKSKHCEISMCYDVNENTGEFTYLLGRGIDYVDDLKNIESDMTRVDIRGGLYAIFSTTPADSYIQIAQDTWNDIFLNWLPQSEFEYDEARHDFEYHDLRDHGCYFGGKLQIDICIPIRQRKEEIQKSKQRLSR